MELVSEFSIIITPVRHLLTNIMLIARLLTAMSLLYMQRTLSILKTSNIYRMTVVN